MMLWKMFRRVIEVRRMVPDEMRIMKRWSILVELSAIMSKGVATSVWDNL